MARRAGRQRRSCGEEDHDAHPAPASTSGSPKRFLALKTGHSASRTISAPKTVRDTVHSIEVATMLDHKLEQLVAEAIR
jgi:hypothetical protein